MAKKEEKPRKAEIQIPPSPSVEEGYVILPYGKEEFRNFVKSLLGSPQSIGKLFRGNFDFEINDIRNLYFLLLQRVSQQNEGVLANFSSKIIFSDNSTVEINSIEELLTYNEVRPIISRAVHLTWDFVVRFQDKQFPEKQRIQISIISSGEDIPAIDENIPYLQRYSVRKSGLISFRIEHTARTWGADIEALLSNHIKSLLREPSKIKEFIRKHRSALSNTIIVALMTITLIGGFFAAKRFAATRIVELNQHISTVALNENDAVNGKLDYLAMMAANGVWARFAYGLVTFVVVMFFVSFFLMYWFENSADSTDPSFVLLTKEAHKEKTKVYSKLRLQWLSFILANIVAIIAGVVSNFIFAWLSGV